MALSKKRVMSSISLVFLTSHQKEPRMAQNHNSLVVIYTDGSCLANPGPGGWAAILQWHENTREISGGEADTTIIEWS